MHNPTTTYFASASLSMTSVLTSRLDAFDDTAAREVLARAALSLGEGDVARYIPMLSEVDPLRLGFAVARLDGKVFQAGDADVRFSIQSISKLFALTLALSKMGPELWLRVGRQPSANPFNSLIELELEQGVPRNPFVNAGALVVADVLSSCFVQMEASVTHLLRSLSGQPSIGYDQRVARSEWDQAFRHRAAGHLMKSFGNFLNPVDEVVIAYCRQCALEASCIELALSARFLANGGVDPASGRPVLDAVLSRQLSALMATCGTYEGSGEAAFSIGLPLKSGVGGGILAIVPGYGAVCAWSPRLDATGNSIAAMKALALFADDTGSSVFA
jgi:glutaminase